MFHVNHFVAAADFVTVGMAFEAERLISALTRIVSRFIRASVRTRCERCKMAGHDAGECPLKMTGMLPGALLKGPVWMVKR